MKDRAIFLDIDGVLNGAKYFKSRDYKKREKEDIHSKMICRVNLFWVSLLCKLFKPKIVLSSSWRYFWNYDGTLNKKFKDRYLAIDNLFRKYGINIVSRTPNKTDNLMKYNIDLEKFNMWKETIGDMSIETIITYSRGAQILKWIEENKFNGKYVILEDDIIDVLFFKDLKHHLIKTSFYAKNFGFRFKHFVKACLKLL